MSKAPPVTLSDLAKRLNVSATTVSKALRGKPGIGPEMVRRVEALAKELKYQPNFAAQMLKTNASGAIGVLIAGDIVNPWYSQLVSCLEDRLYDAGLGMLLALGKENPERERKSLVNFSSGRAAGVILGPICRERNLQPLWEALDKGVPLLAFNCVEELPISYVAIDQREGARLAVEHLISRGHRKIAYICCPPPDLQETGRTRGDGFIEAMFSRNLPLDSGSIVAGGNSRRDGFESMRKLLALPLAERPSAVFCHNDNVAMGAMAAIQRAGLKVPDDFSLVGFDDIEESSSCVPPLTTVGGVMRELSSKLVATMRRLIEERPSAPLKELIAPKLIERASVRSV